jgi:hypothetical protein
MIEDNLMEKLKPEVLEVFLAEEKLYPATMGRIRTELESIDSILHISYLSAYDIINVVGGKTYSFLDVDNLFED